MEPITTFFTAINALLLGINDSFVKPSKSNQKELTEHHRILDKAYIDFDLTMHRLFVQLEKGGYETVKEELLKLDNILDQDFRQIIYLVENMRTKISLLDIHELTESLGKVAEKCIDVLGCWKELQKAIASENPKLIKRLCNRNREVIKTYVEEINNLADRAENILDQRQFKLSKPQKTKKKTN